jgi:hypothetical protein
MAAIATPAWATFDLDYTCSDGTTMSYSGPHDDMVIKLQSGALLQLPGAGPDRYTGVFAAYKSLGAQCAVGSPLVPCAAHDLMKQERAHYIVRDTLIQCEAVPYEEE